MINFANFPESFKHDQNFRKLQILHIYYNFTFFPHTFRTVICVQLFLKQYLAVSARQFLTDT